MSIASEPILPARGLRTARRLAAGVVLATLVASAGAEWARAGENLEEFRVDGNFIVGIVQRRWEALALPVGWRIHRDGVINNTNNGNTAPLSVDQAAAVVEQAFQRWNEIPDAALEAVFDLGCNLTGLRIDIECLDGKTSTALSGLDGENIMTWSDPGAVGPSALAVTIITSLQEDLTLTSANRDLNGDGHPDISALIYPDGVTLPAGTMVDADIVYNTAGFDWLGEPSPIARVVDLLGIALHEQGHWFGLAHSPLIEPTAVMFPFVDLSSLERIEGLQTLTTDDRSAALRVYPLEPGASQNFGIVRGTLVDASGQPVEGEPVVAIDALTLERVSFGFSAHALSEIRPEDGSFTIEGLPPGTYLLQVEALDGAHGYLNRLRYNASTSLSAFGGHRPSLVVEAAVESDQDDLLAPRRVSVPALAEGGIIDVGAIVVNTEEPDVSPLGAATLLGFKDNEAILADFPEGFLFPFYGIEYRQMFVYDNGYVTFTNATNPSPDPINIRVVGTRFADESLEEFLTNSPRVAVLFRNHDPSTDDRGPNKGPIDVYLESGPDHVALTWAAVPEVWLNTSLQDKPVRGGTFRLTLFVDGLIEMEYGSLSTPYATVGITPGGTGVVAAHVDLSRSAFVQAGPLEAVVEEFSMGRWDFDQGLVRFFAGLDLSGGRVRFVPGVDFAYTVTRPDLQALEVSPPGAAVPLTAQGAPDTLLAWESGFPLYNLYRGLLSVLGATGLYTPDSSACLGPGLLAPQFTDSGSPPAGEGFYYLVSAEIDGLEGTLGASSAGGERLNTIPCP